MSSNPKPPISLTMSSFLTGTGAIGSGRAAIIIETTEQRTDISAPFVNKMKLENMKDLKLELGVQQRKDLISWRKKMHRWVQPFMPLISRIINVLNAHTATTFNGLFFFFFCFWRKSIRPLTSYSCREQAFRLSPDRCVQVEHASRRLCEISRTHTPAIASGQWPNATWGG